MTRLTSVYGLFTARVMAARLTCEGFDVELRGAVHSPYPFTVGDMARIDLYVPSDQAEEASLVLLVDEVDEADEILDDDRPPRRREPGTRAWAAIAMLVTMTAASVALVVRCY